MRQFMRKMPINMKMILVIGTLFVVSTISSGTLYQRILKDSYTKEAGQLSEQVLNSIHKGIDNQLGSIKSYAKLRMLDENTQKMLNQQNEAYTLERLSLIHISACPTCRRRVRCVAGRRR